MKSMVTRGALVIGVLLAAGCGGVPSIKEALQPGAAPAKELTQAEKNLKRFGLLHEEEACPECWVTGGGAGNADACDDGVGGTAKFGLVADPGGGDGEGGHLQFQFENTLSGFRYNIGGPVDAVRCLDIHQALDGGGDTWGKVEFFGILSKTNGIEDDEQTYTFHVVVEDFGEPNTDDTLWIDLVDEQGNSLAGFPFQCTTDDGNIQLHDTRAAQL